MIKAIILQAARQQYQQFRAMYASYAKTILARVRLMKKTAEKRRGAGALQESLF